MMYYIYNYNHDEQDIFNKIARYHIEFEKKYILLKMEMEEQEDYL